MSEKFLAYFADPMCSWCYGFGPELDALLARTPGIRVDIIMGGLRPFNRKKTTAEFRGMLAEHWSSVHLESGLPFRDDALAREDFVYDTEPSCRAVVTVRSIDPGLGLPMLKSIHAAFYGDGRDVTSTEVLADLARGLGIDRAAFVASFMSIEMRDETRLDFSTAQQMGVTGFPTLGVGYPSGQLFLLASGFTRADVLEERLARIDASTASGTKRLAQGDD